MNIQDILSREEQFRYQMLGRMQSDCEHYIATGMRTTRNLWAGTPELQIEYMKKIWKSFDSDKKPEWLKYGQIIKYEKQMIPQKEKVTEWLIGYIDSERIMICRSISTTLANAKLKMKEVIMCTEGINDKVKLGVEFKRYSIMKQKTIPDDAYIVVNYYDIKGCKDIKTKNCLSHRNYILNDRMYIILSKKSYYNNHYVRGISMQLI